MDRERAEAAIREFLSALGHDPAQNPDLAETPERVVRAFHDELLCGHSVAVDGLIHAGSAPHRGSADIVVVRDVTTATMCPHHLLPSLGKATVAYVPGRRLLGLGTVADVVDAFARRLTLQEMIGRNVVDALMSDAGAEGAWCRLELVHGCLSARGASRAEALVISVARAGSLASADSDAALALALGTSP